MNKDERKIDVALGEIRDSIEKYCSIQMDFEHCNVSKDRSFQKRFNAFYRVRRSIVWQAHFYEVMERTKQTRPCFAIALREMKSRTGRLEASFVSKMIATIDPQKPIIDRFVLLYFNLRLPAYNRSDREKAIIKVYDDLCDQYKVKMSGNGRNICKRFDEVYPERASKVSNLKKVDFVLWRFRSSNKD